MPAQVALDVAAPDELAFALLGDVAHAGLVAPAAAQEPAPVQAQGCSVAHAASGSGDSQSAKFVKNVNVFEITVKINREKLNFVKLLSWNFNSYQL